MVLGGSVYLAILSFLLPLESCAVVAKHPKNTPLEEWPNWWLMVETASWLDKPEYLAMTDSERIEHAWPASREQRMIFIKECWMIN